MWMPPQNVRTRVSLSGCNAKNREIHNSYVNIFVFTCVIIWYTVWNLRKICHDFTDILCICLTCILTVFLFLRYYVMSVICWWWTYYIVPIRVDIIQRSPSAVKATGIMLSVWSKSLDTKLKTKINFPSPTSQVLSVQSHVINVKTLKEFNKRY